MAAKCLVSYRCEKKYHEQVVYGMSIEDGIVPFLRSVKSLEGEEYIVLSVIPLTEEEAAEISNMKLNSF